MNAMQSLTSNFKSPSLPVDGDGAERYGATSVSSSCTSGDNQSFACKYSYMIGRHRDTSPEGGDPSSNTCNHSGVRVPSLDLRALLTSNQLLWFTSATANMTLEDSSLHKVARATVEAVGTPAQSFVPINQIHQVSPFATICDSPHLQRA